MLYFITHLINEPGRKNRTLDRGKLGKPTRKESAVFFNIVLKAFDPPPLLFEHLSYFAGGVFLKRVFEHLI